MKDYRMRLHTRLSEVSHIQWDDLVRQSHHGILHPALRHAYLSGLEETACVGADTGWNPCHLALYDEQGTLAAACPLYLKQHSYGEYVFDWAWADAYHRNGLVYYPKLLTAIPFTPVFGHRFLAASDTARVALWKALSTLVHEACSDEKALGVRASSWHGLFLSAQDRQAATPEATAPHSHSLPVLARHGVQFHWQNASPHTGQPYTDMAIFLDSLDQKKRKNIRAERRKVRDSGVCIQTVQGADITPAQLAFVYRSYSNTYLERQSSPYMTRAFFEHMVRTMPESLVFFIAYRDHTPLGMSLCLQSETHLYGRYWGCIEQVPCMHFETAYYSPLEYAIARGLRVFEGGAQGEHKWARGFAPQAAHSLHHLSHPAFYDAVERFLSRETHGIQSYLDELQEHSPFKPMRSE